MFATMDRGCEAVQMPGKESVDMDYQDELTAKRRDALWRAVERERRARGIRLPVAYLEGPSTPIELKSQPNASMALGSMVHGLLNEHYKRKGPGWQWWAVRLGVGLGWLALGLGMGWLAATVEGGLL